MEAAAAAMALPLPDDALVKVLARLPVRSLAASRCVCKAWRALVDARELLLPHALPHEPRVITEDTYEPDHVPYLVFDPVVSPHYEVFLIPLVPEKPKPADPRDIPSTTFSFNGLFSDDDTMGAEDTEEVEEEDEEYLEELVKSPPPPPSIEAGYFPARRLPLTTGNYQHDIDLEQSHLCASQRLSHRTVVGHWMLMDGDNGNDNNILPEGHTEWDFDVDGILHYDEDEDYHCSRVIDFLGFHPYKEVVFLMVSSTVVAYHLKTSKIQWLGESYSEDYDTISQGIYEAFPYTPCLIGKLRKKLPQRTSA
ncbi:hypothetical protein PR202_ga26145 [Eleusine coracana subsp. coracana]|uniref:F-box domain-containing protein n=1 Tax=Eleusine coracana subsp. coracana TaxID=191504 RepID=A0AAV5DE45_ELECO|nr:hypothetical protein PR202_ga26145 [Eleusine coracana subsp. coracana]